MGLYENEDVYLYDPETGNETDATQQRRQESEADDVISEAQKLESLKKNRGWKVLTEWVDGVVTQYKEALVHEADQAKIVRLQEAIKCYQNIHGFVDFRISEGNQFLERKRTLERQANPKE